MITKQQAERIAEDVIGHGRADSAEPWELVEFDQGWLVREAPPPGGEIFGEAHRVVERATGSVLVFPSRIPPDRILHEYPDVRDAGIVERS